ncbi:MAG: FtsX-like permease family protein [Eubacterium sp.]|nr:FtsX-like permease family protein [Eubacterium sp.]
MSVWKRAMLYLARKKGRTVLLFFYIVVMSGFILTAFSLKNAAEQQLTRLRQTLGTGFVLRIDTENAANVGIVVDDNGYTDSTYIGTRITDQTIEKVLELDGVTNYTLPKEFDIVWTGLSLRAGFWSEFTPDETLTEQHVEVSKQQILAYSCINGELNKNFLTGALEISEGRNLREGDSFQTVISEKLAERNGLSIGDHIMIEVKEAAYRFSKSPQTTWGDPIQLEVTGIFHMNFSQQDSEWTTESGYMENDIFVDMHTHAKINEYIEGNWEGELADIGYPEVIFFVEDPEKTDAIIQEMKGRKDIDISGLLVSLGVKKREIAGQMLLECLWISIAALSVSVLLSIPLNFACSHAAEHIMMPDQKEQTYRVTLREGMFPEPEKVSADEIVLFGEVTPKVIMLLIVLVIVISHVSVLLALVQILEIEPKRLLQRM